MVQSVCKNYKDIVCLVPVEKLDTSLLHYWFNKVMKYLSKIFIVVAVSVDNHICNRWKMFVLIFCFLIVFADIYIIAGFINNVLFLW